jgi:hypothetical protein
MGLHDGYGRRLEKATFDVASVTILFSSRISTTDLFVGEADNVGDPLGSTVSIFAASEI